MPDGLVQYRLAERGHLLAIYQINNKDNKFIKGYPTHKLQ